MNKTKPSVVDQIAMPTIRMKATDDHKEMTVTVIAAICKEVGREGWWSELAKLHRQGKLKEVQRDDVWQERLCRSLRRSFHKLSLQPPAMLYCWMESLNHVFLLNSNEHHELVFLLCPVQHASLDFVQSRLGRRENEPH